MNSLKLNAKNKLTYTELKKTSLFHFNLHQVLAMSNNRQLIYKPVTNIYYEKIDSLLDTLHHAVITHPKFEKIQKLVELKTITNDEANAILKKTFFTSIRTVGEVDAFYTNKLHQLPHHFNQWTPPDEVDNYLRSVI